VSAVKRRSAIFLLALALPLPLCGCAGRLGAAHAGAEPTRPASSAIASQTEPAPSRLVLTADQVLPTWLTDAVHLFARATELPIELPSAAALESSASAGSDAPLPAGDLRWLDAAEARALGKSGDLTALTPELATALSPGLTEQSFAAFEEMGRHWGVPLSASWLGMVVDAEALPAGEREAPPLLGDWLAQLRRVRALAPAGGGPPAAPLWVAWDEPGCADTFALLVAAMGGRLLNDRGLPAFADEGDAGSRALEFMVRLLKEGFVPKNALETHAADLPTSLGKGHVYWIGWSEALEASLTGAERRPLLRRLGQVQPCAFPVDSKVYSYETRPAVLLVRYQGLAVSAASHSAGAWKLAHFVADPLILDAASQLTTVLRAPAPPSGAFAVQSRALLTKEGQLARWELTPEARLTLGRFIQAALKKTLPPEEALTRAAQALGAPAPPPTAPPSTGLTPPASTPTATGVPAPPAGARTTPSPPTAGGPVPGMPLAPAPADTGSAPVSPGVGPSARPGTVSPGPNGAAVPVPGAPPP
jgi:ABC-type glycerol-3-phosphate transport system substrate-binding protein